VPAYKADGTDPFNASRMIVEFVVRGKPHPQYRDKPGWNFTRYNPSKTLQMQFCHIAVKQCLNHAGSVPNFGADARIKIEIHCRFPSPKTGQIKNTADIDTYANLFLMPAMKLSMVMMVKLYAFMPTKIMTMNMVARDTRK
jgi:hypothetical protein